MDGQIFGQILEARFFDDSEIIPVDHPRSDRPRGFHQITKKLAQLRRAAGEVHHSRRILLDPGANPARGLLAHHLGAPRSSIDMTMPASLVALATEIDLKGFKGSPIQRQAM